MKIKVNLNYQLSHLRERFHDFGVYTDIFSGIAHRPFNSGTIPSEIIVVQSGIYPGDNIVRLEANMDQLKKMSKSIKIYVAGHRGMVGSSIVQHLKQESNVITILRTHEELDLTNQNAVNNFFKSEKPDQVYLAAAKVGGIYANNTYPAEFIYQNIMIEANVINAAYHNGVKKLLFLGSSCIYPRLSPQPMSEDVLLSSTLEPTNEPYAIAKIAGIKLCESYNRQYGESHGIDYRSVMPSNLYGPGDNYHPEDSHVIPGLIRRFHDAKVNKAKEVIIWGDGSPRREFLYVDDMAAACIFIMNLDKVIHDQHTSPMLSHINIGSGKDLTIQELGAIISKVIGYDGDIRFDHSKPNGTPRKLMDSSKLQFLGWKPKVGLEQGLGKAYSDFLKSETANF